MRFWPAWRDFVIGLQTQDTSAKALIDSARDNFRALIHSRISLLRRNQLIRFCIEQLDALTAEYDHKQTRIQMSLAHEVNYDRTKSLAEAQEQFTRQSRNYRYLLECYLSMTFPRFYRHLSKGGA